jgi:N-acetylneuraminate synthase
MTRTTAVMTRPRPDAPGAAGQLAEIRVGCRAVGPRHPVYVVAEVGVNHNGSPALAADLVRRAAEAGADAVKFQAFVPERLCSAVHRADEIQMLRPLALAEADLAALKELAGRLGMDFLCTPFDEQSVEVVRRLACPAIKIGSGELTHTPMLGRVAGFGVPVIVSTGAGATADVDRAVAALRAGGAEQIALLHCTSAYPAPAEQANLAAIPLMRQRYPDCVIGYSDHTEGPMAAVMAVALGAAIIEKHLTLDRRMAGPDHAASAEPAELAELIAQVRQARRMLGDPVKRPAACEPTIGRSLVAAGDLPAGTVLAREHVAFKRPGTGIRPYRLNDVLGRRLLRDVPADELILERDIEKQPRMDTDEH